MKWTREWFIRVPWGKLNLVSRGHPDGDPVFLVHGRQDSLAIFEPLIEQMSEEYFYVALDMPGNGLSDAFPHVTNEQLPKSELSYACVFDTPPKPARPFIEFNKYYQGLLYALNIPDKGPKLQRFHFLYAMELALLHLGWDKFVFMGHSMGCEQGLFYNVIYPGTITKMILLDAGPTLMRMQIEDNAEYQQLFFDSYYENYERDNFKRKLHTRRSASHSLQKLRDLTDDQAEHLVSRNFHELKAGTSDGQTGQNDKEQKGTESRSSNAEYGPYGPPNPKRSPTVSADLSNALPSEAQNATEQDINVIFTSSRAQGAPHTNNASNTNDAPPTHNVPRTHNAPRTQNVRRIPNLNWDPLAPWNQIVPEARSALEALSILVYENGPRIRIRQREREEIDTDYETDEDEPRDAHRRWRNANRRHLPRDSGNDENICGLIQHMSGQDSVGYLSWDNRLKNLAPQNYGNDYYFELFKTIPPTLLIAASDGAKNVPPNPKWRQGAKELLNRMATLDNFHRVDVEGSHDVHYTHPERVLPFINAFLKDNKVSSKL